MLTNNTASKRTMKMVLFVRIVRNKTKRHSQQTDNLLAVPCFYIVSIVTLDNLQHLYIQRRLFQYKHRRDIILLAS